jgi:transposase-like protein
MPPLANPDRYKNHRFPGDMLSHGVWLSSRVHWSARDVQELRFERGIDVTDEALRHGCLTFGQE